MSIHQKKKKQEKLKIFLFHMFWSGGNIFWARSISCKKCHFHIFMCSSNKLASRPRNLVTWATLIFLIWLWHVDLFHSVFWITFLFYFISQFIIIYLQKLALRSSINNLKFVQLLWFCFWLELCNYFGWW